MKQLSVVVACVDAADSIERCLSKFERTCRDLDSEIVVVDASRDRTAELVTTRFPGFRLLRCPYGTLVPELWVRGYEASHGRFVAFTLGQCVPAAEWAGTMLDAAERGASGVGGPMDLAAPASRLDAAVFYLRYSAFIAGTMTAGATEDELAGDNACYRREWLDRFASSFSDGFWEVDFHRLVRAAGGWLTVDPRALVAFGPSSPAKTMCRHRFEHGRRFGAGRVRGGTRHPVLIVAAAPMVPLLLAWRAYLRVHRLQAHRARFLLALPWFLLLAACWAAGEARGAIAAVAAAPSRSRAAEDSTSAGLAAEEAPGP